MLEDYLDNDHHVTSISEIPPTHHSHSHSLVRGKRGIHWPTFSTGCTSYTVQRQAVITPPSNREWGVTPDVSVTDGHWRGGRHRWNQSSPHSEIFWPGWLEELNQLWETGNLNIFRRQIGARHCLKVAVKGSGGLCLSLAIILSDSHKCGRNWSSWYELLLSFSQLHPLLTDLTNLCFCFLTCSFTNHAQIKSILLLNV